MLKRHPYTVGRKLVFAARRAILASDARTLSRVIAASRRTDTFDIVASILDEWSLFGTSDRRATVIAALAMEPV